MKLIDRYLDKYFSRKVNELIKRHLFLLNKKCDIYFDDVFDEYYIETCINNPMLSGGTHYLKYKQSQSIEILISLLLTGFYQLDKENSLLEQQLIKKFGESE